MKKVIRILGKAYNSRRLGDAPPVEKKSGGTT